MRREAREPLLKALEIASRCGANAMRERVREELAVLGARPRRDHLTGVEALTPSELRVAQLAALGKTNREISQALFLTLRTVETHLTQTYRKLDISSRSKLAMVMGGAGEEVGA
jgi:DNA-binding NarL/FixJ family response regulator